MALLGFARDDGDAAQVSIIFLKRARHGRDAFTQVFVPRDVTHDAQGSAHALVGDHAAGLEEGHRGRAGFFHDESDLLERTPPVGDRERAGVDVDGAGERAANLGGRFFRDGVGAHRQLVDDVAATWAQDARGLSHDGSLGFLSLHGEHGLADDDVRALVRQAGFGRVGVHAAPHARGDGVHARRGVRIALHADVGGGTYLNNRRGRDAQAGRELDDVRAGQHGALERPRTECEAAGAQHRLSGAREHPVAGRLFDGPVGEG